MISQQPERPPFLQFEMRAEEDRDASIKSGKPEFKNVAFVMVTPPGGNLVVDRIADEWLAEKRAAGWAFYDLACQAYEAWKRGEEIPVDGTPLKLCTAFTPAEVKQCLAANVRTVEDLAAFPDGQLNRLGMGGIRLKQKAVAWLQSANDVGKTAAELSALRVKIEDLVRTVETQQETIRQQADEIGRLKPKAKAA